MSKSEIAGGGCILLLDKPDDILRAFKRAVTDSDISVRYDVETKPGVSNLIQILSACSDKDIGTIEAEFSGLGYGALKKSAGEAVVETLRPVREEAQRLLSDKAYLQSVYTKGAERASKTAEKTLRKVYHKIGFIQNS